MKTICQKQLDFFCHVMKRNGLEASEENGKNDRSRGRHAKTGIPGQTLYVLIRYCTRSSSRPREQGA